MTDGAVSRRREGSGIGLGFTGGVAGPPVPKFDPPVRHNSFADWEQDYNRAKKAHASVGAALEQLRSASEAQRDELRRVAMFAARREKPGISIVKCMAVDDAHSAIISGLEVVHFWANYELVDLEYQRETYWRKSANKSPRGRKRHAKKYWIASELARFYVAMLNEKPTFAMTDYGEPSGRYTTALRDIFEICGLGGRDLRGPAEEAIANAPAVIGDSGRLNALGGLMTYWPD